MDWVQTIVIIGGILVPMMAGFAWVAHRMDIRFDKLDAKLERIESATVRTEKVNVDVTNQRLSKLEGAFEERGRLERRG